MHGRKPEDRWLRAEEAEVSPAIAEAMIHVSSLSRLRDVAASLGTFDMLTMLSPGSGVSATDGLHPERHLHLSFHDIVEARPDFVMPDRKVVEAILDFGRGWTSGRPMLIHCWAGISRSSAAAYVMACERSPGSEHDLAAELRRRAPFATPNRLMVALADDILERNGAMTAAIATIGRGADTFEGIPYQLPVRWPTPA
jgi:predicted protein tyrosine phosphatase